MTDETVAATPVSPAPQRSNLKLRKYEIVDAPELGGLVALREARAAEITPYFAEAVKDGVTFMKRVVAATLEIDGERLSVEDLDDLPMSKFLAIQKLFPAIQAINGIPTGAEGELKND